MAARPGGGSNGGGVQNDLVVGHYRIGGEIGRGSFATVYKGHHTVSSPPSPPIQPLTLLCWLLFASCGEARDVKAGDRTIGDIGMYFGTASSYAPAWG